MTFLEFSFHGRVLKDIVDIERHRRYSMLAREAHARREVNAGDDDWPRSWWPKVADVVLKAR
jgi:hypothetical protein